MQAVALENATHGITCNVVCPASTATPSEYDNIWKAFLLPEILQNKPRSLLERLNLRLRKRLVEIQQNMVRRDRMKTTIV